MVDTNDWFVPQLRHSASYNGGALQGRSHSWTFGITDDIDLFRLHIGLV